MSSYTEQVIYNRPIICGGLNETQPANDDIQYLIDKLSEEIQVRTGKDFPFLKAVEFRNQVVAGKNFFIKVNAGKEHIHVKIYVPLPVNGDQPELHDVQFGKTLNDEITYF